MLTHYASEQLNCGVDEAGRGCIAGPVVAAAVILPKDFRHAYLNDSKQLSVKQRNELRPLIEREALAFGVGIIDHARIDEVNILQATYLAMHEAIRQLTVKPELLLIDGNRFKPYAGIRHQCVIKGDATYLEIAAASVLAKTYRDAIMEQLHEKHPAYNWGRNKGYPTIDHREAVRQHGPSPYHRISFQLLKADQPELF